MGSQAETERWRMGEVVSQGAEREDRVRKEKQNEGREGYKSECVWVGGVKCKSYGVR